MKRGGEKGWERGRSIRKEEVGKGVGKEEEAEGERLELRRMEEDKQNKK